MAGRTYPCIIACLAAWASAPKTELKNCSGSMGSSGVTVSAVVNIAWLLGLVDLV